MLDGNDKDTWYSIRELQQVASKGGKPLLLWIGAGASSWCGYKRWPELADEFHSKFLRLEKTYNKEEGLSLIREKDYPKFFQFCQDLNSRLYYSSLAENFTPREITPVYSRFVQSLNQISPSHLITTNVDECLEREVDNISVIQRSDGERAIDLLSNKQSFLYKIHGSISEIKSTIFTISEYQDLIAKESFLNVVQHLFLSTHVVFISYGLQDKYVIQLLKKTSSVRRIFGDGPHFAVLPMLCDLPENVRLIKYIPRLHEDHRAQIQVVEEIRRMVNSLDETIPETKTRSQKDLESVHLISSFYIPGTHTTSQTLNIKRGDGKSGNHQLIVGEGFVENEMYSTAATGMHDLIVGLLCFNNTYMPLTARMCHS